VEQKAGEKKITGSIKIEPVILKNKIIP